MKKTDTKPKDAEPIDTELIEQFKRALEDLKHGRIREWKGEDR